MSASFIKELLRRAALFAAEEGEELIVTDRHLAEALDELLIAGSLLTLRLLGGKPPSPDAELESEWLDEEFEE